MLTHTADWKAHSKVIDSRMRINFTDVLKDPTITVTTTDNADWKPSNMPIIARQQAVNGKDDMTHKWFAADGVTICDGSFWSCPSNSQLAGYNEVGYWSNTHSTAGGAISLSDSLKVDFSSRGVGSYFISFDCQRDEYAVDFTVEFYQDAVLAYTSTVTNNTECKREIVIPFQDDITRIVFNTTKLNKENVCLKIAEFTTAVIKNYDLNDIIEFNLLEQREVSDENSVPQGNIASSELNFSILNENREFDYNNTDSRLHGLIKNNAKVDLEIGILQPSGFFEYVPLFSGYAKKFSVPEESLQVSCYARDRLELLRQSNVTPTGIVKNRSFYDWFEWVLNDAGIESVNIDIDTTLQAQTVPIGWFDSVKHRFALQELARGSNSVIYMSRENKFVVKALSSFPTTPSESYDRDHYKHKNNQPVFETLANVVTVTTSPLVLKAGIELYKTGTEKEEIEASTQKVFTFKYTKSPAENQNYTPTLPSGVTIVGVPTYYSWGASFTVNNTNPTNQEFEIAINGDIYEVEGSKVVQVKDQSSIDENGNQELRWKTSKWIQTRTQAKTIADSIVNVFANPQKDVQLSFENNGNPASELGDLFSLTDLYSTTNYGIIEQEITFNGLFTHFIKGRIDA